MANPLKKMLWVLGGVFGGGIVLFGVVSFFIYWIWQTSLPLSETIWEGPIPKSIFPMYAWETPHYQMAAFLDKRHELLVILTRSKAVSLHKTLDPRAIKHTLKAYANDKELDSTVQTYAQEGISQGQAGTLMLNHSVPVGNVQVPATKGSAPVSVGVFLSKSMHQVLYVAMSPTDTVNSYKVKQFIEAMPFSTQAADPSEPNAKANPKPHHVPMRQAL